MSWISELYKTYEYLEKDTPTLLPPAVMQQNAHITVVLNEKSEFVTAKFIEKEDMPTAVPVTEKSASRTSGSEPHGIFDNLTYIAGDLEKYILKTGKKEIYSNFFTPYILNLENWVKSDYSNEFAETIYNYLKKERLVTDLVKSEMVLLDDNGFIDNKIKRENVEQNKFFVRFSIEKDGEIYDLWKLKSFLENYSKYYISTIPKEKDGFCYITGEKRALSDLHGKNIRYAGDGAKLISSNDSTNYTYRGRFEDSSEVYGVSYEVSQKAHSALRYLIKKQGVTKNDHTILTWINSEYFPKVFDATSSSLDFFDEEDEFDIKEIDTFEKFSSEMEKLINGRKTKYNFNQKVNTISLDSATPGRMSIVYYSEKSVNDYLENIKKWNSETAWEYVGFEDKKPFNYIGTVSPFDLIYYSFGTEQNGMMKLGGNDKYFNQLLKRLLPCIIDGARIPTDFVLQAVRNASNPQSKGRYNWEKCVNIACGLLRKYYLDRKGVEFTVALDKNIDDRSYLFGRLLAVADEVESFALSKKGEDRITSAKRFMNTFSKKPFYTWKLIERNLIPYWYAIPIGSRKYFENLLNEINSKFKYDDFNNKPLDTKYLLGYRCQIHDIKNSKKENETNCDNE